MILSDWEIKAAIKAGQIEIDNFQEKHLNSNSYDVTLNVTGWGVPEPTGKVWRETEKYYQVSVYNGSLCAVKIGPTGDGGRYRLPVIDPLDKESYTTRNFELSNPAEYCLWPGEFVLGTVNERIRLANGLVCQLGGKSSLARLGIAVHVTAGFGDAGWGGYYVLEFVNLGPSGVILRPNTPVAQLVFERSTLSELPYNERSKSKYQDQLPGQGSKYYLNKELLNENSLNTYGWFAPNHDLSGERRAVEGTGEDRKVNNEGSPEGK